ncbi:hypothetical protein IFM89_001321 [Coptis chinensis]|uniref:Uncharacterized protein n=1 Tax=Coptis chinensis TaxID=261450 RepID=A0A835GV38_9MAGN|nr:hypothetical protein IFM89_001321 [Coptis chinensis]
MDPIIIVNGNGLQIQQQEQTPQRKGFGLKKWKRIRRDLSASTTNNQTPPTATDDARGDPTDVVSKMLKRGSTSGRRGSSTFPVNSTDSMDNENNNSGGISSSKSSTAASAPTQPLQFTTPSKIFPNKNNNKAKKASPANAVHAKTETAKKPRGGGVKAVDNDASYSSVESDLRSSNALFADISNGKQINFDMDNSSEAQASDQHSNEYPLSRNYSIDNGEQVEEEEEVSQGYDAGGVSWEPNEEQTENQRRPSMSQHLLADSIVSLQAVHEALEKEIGKEPVVLLDDPTHYFFSDPKFQSVVPEVHGTNSSGQIHFDEIEKSCSMPLEAELIKTQSKVYILEGKLEEALSILEIKESRVVELESILNETELPKGEPRSSLLSLQERCAEIESELEDLFQKKIEAEVECLAMRKISQKLKVASEDQIALFEEQKSLLGQQNKILHKLASFG